MSPAAVPAVAGAPLLGAQSLDVGVGPRTLVRGLDLQVQPGQFWCLLGPNGAGKTLLLHTLAGARPAAAGGVRMDGRPLSDWPVAAAARRRGLMPQQLSDAFGAPVLDVVLQGRHAHLSRWVWEGEAERDLAGQALARVGLAGFEARDITTLSGGERQRVALATLLVQDPALALLDEPLAHLDLAHQVEVAALLVEQVRRGRAVVMSVHDLSLAQQVATHVLLLGGPHGQAWAGPVTEVMRADLLQAVFGLSLHRHEVQGRSWWLTG